MSSVISGDLHVTGRITSNSMTIPDDSITDAKIVAGAQVSALKSIARARYPWAYLNADDGPASKTFVVHVATAIGTLQGFSAGAVAVATTGSCTVDLKKNGVTVLSAPITLNTVGAAYDLTAGTVVTTAVAADDVFTVTIINSASDATGIFGRMLLDEEPI